MSEPNNSNPFATSTTISYSYTVDTRLRCDKDYVSSMDGIAKLLTQLFCVACIIAATVIDFDSSKSGEYYICTVSIILCFAGLMFAMYNFHVCEKFYKIHWLKVEFTMYQILGWMLILASVFAITEPHMVTGASVFGFATVIILFLESFRKYKLIRQGTIAQGKRHLVQHYGQSQC